MPVEILFLYTPTSEDGLLHESMCSVYARSVAAPRWLLHGALGHNSMPLGRWRRLCLCTQGQGWDALLLLGL